MICLTGDLHHQSLRTGNQRHADATEIAIAARYLERLREARVKATFFVTGRAFEEQWAELRPICEEELVEIGGHTYDCFEPAIVHRAAKKLVGSYNGPRWMEKRDVEKTIASARRRTGRVITSWRNHMYMHGPATYAVLADAGISTCSDVVRKAAPGPHWAAPGLLELPINVIPDHEHLYHAERTEQWVAWWQRRYGFRDDFGSESYEVGRWTELVLAQLAANEAAGRLSTVLIHPITLYLCDRFASFERILSFMEGCKTVHVGEVAALARSRTERALGVWS